MITTRADTNGAKSGVLKLDLRSVPATTPFTIFGLRETDPDQKSRPSIKYIEESSQKKLSVEIPSGLYENNPEKLDCTLPTDCRIVYTYSSTSGVIAVYETNGTLVAEKTHTLRNFGNTTLNPDYSGTSNGVMIFHHCVARAELVVAPGSSDFTEAQQEALITGTSAWARRTSST
jgi:hypothetical protein